MQVRKYWESGTPPEAEHTFTKVDEHGFQAPEHALLVETMAVEDRELLEAWSGLGEAVLPLQL